MAYIVMANIVVALGMVYIVMAYKVMACMVMTHIVMALGMVYTLPCEVRQRRRRTASIATYPEQS